MLYAERLNDTLAARLIQHGFVASNEEASDVELSLEGSTQFWINSMGSRIENAGFETKWNRKINNA